jgi:hypothetical protein
MQTDFTDPKLNKRLLCKYCKLPINKVPLILSNEKIFPGIYIINHPVHPECHGPYISHLKNMIISYLALGMAVLSIILTILFQLI